MSDERLARIRAAATRPRRVVPILTDGEVRGQIEAVEDALDELDQAAAPAVDDRRLSTRPAEDKARAELLAELDSLRAQAADSTLLVVVEGMPRKAYRALLAEHPPRLGEDGKPVRADIGGANVETLAEPLTRASIVGYQESDDAGAAVLPMDDEFLDWLLDFATDRQLDLLSGAALLCNGLDGAGDDALPLPRRRTPSPTTTSAAE